MEFIEKLLFLSLPLTYFSGTWLTFQPNCFLPCRGQLWAHHCRAALSFMFLLQLLFFLLEFPSYTLPSANRHWPPTLSWIPSTPAPKMCDGLGHACRELILCLHPPGSSFLLVPGEADSKEVEGHWVASESPACTVCTLPPFHSPAFAHHWSDVACCIITTQFSSSAFSGSSWLFLWCARWASLFHWA